MNSHASQPRAHEPAPPASGSTASGGAAAIRATAPVTVEPVSLGDEWRWLTPAESAALATQARTGDEMARAAFLRWLRPVVWRLARRAAARAQALGLGTVLGVDDLVQEAHVAALRLLSEWDPERCAPLAFFYFRIRAALSRTVSQHARRNPTGTRLPWDHRPTQRLLEETAGQAWDEREGWRNGGADAALATAIERLSPRDRRIVFWTYWRDLDDRQIAAALGISTPAAQQARYRALQRLRLALTQAGYRPRYSR